jgi:hypothetical protein
MKQTIRPFTPEAKARLANLPRAINSRFDSALWSTEDTLERELRELGVRGEYVLMMDVEESDLRLDGAIRANAKPHSQQVAVAFETKRGPLLFACGRFTTWQDNLRAIALGLEALRKVDRYGITQSDEQYTGFRALPAATPMPSSMTVEDATEFLLEHAGDDEHTPRNVLDDPALADTLYRRAAKKLHPDAGGSEELFSELGNAIALVRAAS